jgi:hypothetical protein
MRDRHLSLAKEMWKADGGNLFAMDILASAVLNRSLSLCAGFGRLVREQNYLCAASLVRLRLDSCLRFFAGYLVEDCHTFATSVLKGIPVRKMNDRLGKNMTDRYLVDTLGKQYPWMPTVYEATSGFIHLSEKHIFSIVKTVEDRGKVSFTLSGSGESVPLPLWREMADGFLAATNAQFEYLEGWVFTKANPELVRSLRAEHER